MRYGTRDSRMNGDEDPEFRRQPQSDRRSYERGGNTLSPDYLEQIRMSSDGCPHDIPQYVLERRR